MHYRKTAAGVHALKDHAAPLTRRQRSALILFDGRRAVAEVLTATQGLGVTQADIDQLIGMALLAPVDPAPTLAAAPVIPPEIPAPLRLSGEDRYRAAYPLAVQLAGTLGSRAGRLNLALEAAGNCEELLALLPQLRAVVGEERTRSLEKVLRG